MEVTGPAEALLASVADIEAHSSFNGAGVRLIPYWLACLLGLALLGPRDRASFGRLPVWSTLFKVAAMAGALEARVLSSSHFDARRGYELSTLVAALARARPKAFADDPEPFLVVPSDATLVRTARELAGETHAQTDLRIAAGGDDALGRPVCAPAACEQLLLVPHGLDAELGTFAVLAWLEPVLYPRFTREARVSTTSGFRFLMRAVARRAFDAFLDTNGLPDVDFMDDADVMTQVVDTIRSRLPPSALRVVPSSPASARITFMRLFERLRSLSPFW